MIWQRLHFSPQPSHERVAVREQAVDILGAIADPAAIPALIDALRDIESRVRFSAVGALGAMPADVRVDAALEQAQGDVDRNVSTLARHMLASR